MTFFFFFKQKTAYEMLRSLVGSEMCIRDRDRPYQKAMKFEYAVARIESFVNTRYDAEVVAAFTSACREGQIRPGSVRLKKPTTVVPQPELVTPHDEARVPVS